MNLVTNGDFEEFNKCPTVDNCLTTNNWYSPNKSTPDYYNLNCDPFFYYDELPNGIYKPQSGNGYVGIIALAAQGYMEHIQSKLAVPLIGGKKYFVSFYIYYVSSISYYSSYKIGAYFTRDKILSDTLNSGYYQYNMRPNYIATFENKPGNFLSKSSWELISGEFIANGDEQYITLGCFYENNKLIDKQCSEYQKKYKYKNGGKIPAIEKTLLKRNRLSKEPEYSPTKWAYYFIDNVNVYQIEN